MLRGVLPKENRGNYQVFGEIRSNDFVDLPACIPLSTDELHLWWVGFGDRDAQWPRERLRSRVHQAIKDLGERYLVKSAGCDLCVDAHGRRSFARTLELQFSTTYFNRCAMIAFARRDRLGIDVEPWPNADCGDVVDTHFSQREKESWSKLAAGTRTTSFLRAWTIKEAALKAIGVGLARGLIHPTVEMDPSRPVSFEEPEFKGLHILHGTLANEGMLSVVTDWRPTGIAFYRWPI